MEFKEFKRIVIKVGSSTLTYENGKPNLRRIEQLCRVVSDLKNRDIEVTQELVEYLRSIDNIECKLN